MIKLQYDHQAPDLFKALGITQEASQEAMQTLHGMQNNFPKEAFSSHIERTLELFKDNDTMTAILLMSIGGMIERQRIQAMQELDQSVEKSRPT